MVDFAEVEVAELAAVGDEFEDLVVAAVVNEVFCKGAFAGGVGETSFDFDGEVEGVGFAEATDCVKVFESGGEAVGFGVMDADH